MACSGESFSAWAASPTNQPRSSPLGSGSQAPVKCQPLSQISTQVWLPGLLAHSGVPANRVGTPTLRQASLSRIDRPVHDAMPWSIDSLGLWLAALRWVEYCTLSLAKTVEVQLLSRLRRRLAVLDERQTQVVKVFPPGVACLIDVGVGENVVEEDLLGNLACPRRLPAGPCRRDRRFPAGSRPGASGDRASGMLATRNTMPLRWSRGAAASAFSSSARLPAARGRAPAPPRLGHHGFFAGSAATATTHAISRKVARMA